jgi:RNA polymerase-binding transcription factor DksA
MDEHFTASMKDRLEQALKEELSSLELEREEFEEILAEVQAEDAPQIGKLTHDKASLGLQAILDENRIRAIGSALYRIHRGTYGVCQTCGATISSERLEAKPEAALCINCRERHERES